MRVALLSLLVCLSAYTPEAGAEETVRIAVREKASALTLSAGKLWYALPPGGAKYTPPGGKKYTPPGGERHISPGGTEGHPLSPKEATRERHNLPPEELSWQEVPGGTARLSSKSGKLWLNAKPLQAQSLLFRAGGAGLLPPSPQTASPLNPRAAGKPATGEAAPGKARGRTTARESPLRLGDKTLRGQVEVFATPQGLLAVNILSLEDYLKGVLGKEMPHTFPMEALKAQAVAARTYALQKKLQRLDDTQHLGSTVLHQVYGGLAAEEARTLEAVEATRGQVLLYGMEAVEAYFHASCGGMTETGGEALTRDLPYLSAQPCPCADTPAARWKAHVSEAELKKAFGVSTGQLTGGPLTATGRYKSLRVGGQNVAAAEFRRRLGTTRVRSLKFRIGKEKGGYLLSGEGYGHGAGLCQWGAKRLAEEGKGYADILQHYYVGSRLLTLY